jgi:hypothetical protein
MSEGGAGFDVLSGGAARPATGTDLTLTEASRMLRDQPRGAPPQGLRDRKPARNRGGAVTLEPEPGHAGGGTGADTTQHPSSARRIPAKHVRRQL